MTAMTAMTVHLKSAHILRGKRKSETGCALALAIREIEPHFGIYVGNDLVTVRAHRYDHTFSMDAETQQLVRDFDAGRPIFPRRIKLEVAAMIDREGMNWPGLRERKAA